MSFGLKAHLHKTQHAGRNAHATANQKCQ